MNLAKKIINYLAWTYLVVCMLQVLILPREFLGFLDNIFFLFALAQVVLDSFSNKELRPIIVIFSVFFIWTFVSQFYSNYSNGWFSNLSYQLIILKLLCILLLVINVLKKHENVVIFRRIIDLMFLALVFLNLFIAINPFGIGESIQNIYTSSNYNDFVYYHEPGVFRLSGTQLNPNNNAIVWMCFAIYYLQFLKRKWALLLLAIGILFLTQSRTNVIALIACLFIYFLIQYWPKRNWKRMTYVALPVLVGALIFILKSSYLRALFTGEAFVSKSFLIRLDNYMYLDNFSLIELFIGKGVINKPIDTLGFSLDSEYLGLIFQFGIIGLFCWLTLLIGILKWNKDRNLQVYLLILVIFINSFTNLTLLNLQIGVVLCFFVAVFLNFKRFIK